jgi:hypothetical protein
MEVSGQFHATASLSPITYMAGWAPEPDWTPWRLGKFLAPLWNRTPVVQPTARRYTDWAIPAPTDSVDNEINYRYKHVIVSTNFMIVGSNPIRNMDVYPRGFFVLSCIRTGNGLVIPSMLCVWKSKGALVAASLWEDGWRTNAPA